MVSGLGAVPAVQVKCLDDQIAEAVRLESRMDEQIKSRRFTTDSPECRVLYEKHYWAGQIKEILRAVKAGRVVIL